MATTRKRAEGAVRETAESKAMKDRMAELQTSEIFKQIRKKFGNSTLSLASELKVKRVPRISSGAAPLDYALGGGWAAGRVNEIYGMKSVSKTSLVCLGIAEYQKLCGRCYHPLGACICGEKRKVVAAVLDTEGCIAEDQSIFDPITGYVGTVGGFMQRDGGAFVRSVIDHKLHVEPAVARVDSGMMETVCIRTKTTELRCTPNHPVLTWRGGSARWVEAADLSPGERIARPWRVDFEGVRGTIDPDEGELLGLLLGNGTLADSTPIFTDRRPEVVDRLQMLVSRYGTQLVRFDDRHTRLVQNTGLGGTNRWGEGNVLRRRLGELGCQVTANHKAVPAEILRSDVPVIARVLLGLWMTDGTVNRCRPSLSYCTSSRTLAEHVRWLLSRLGILGRLCRYSDKHPKHSDWYTVTVNGILNLKLFREWVPLYGYKGQLLDTWCAQRAVGRQPDEYSLPGRDENTTDCWWDPVVAVQTAMGPESVTRCWDASVVGGHSWVASDVIVHNTFDVRWAEKLGVDPTALLLERPDNAEEALDIAEALIRAKECDAIAIDSLAFLTTLAEIAKSTSEESPGSQARVLGKAVRKFVAALNSVASEEEGWKPTLWVTNQIRMKIGVMFGCFAHTARVVLEDGSTEKIGKIVNQRLPVRVRTYDPVTNTVGSAAVVAWYNNGKTEEFLQVITEKVGGNGRSQFGVTPNHMIFTPGGKKAAQDLEVGDLVLGTAEEYYSRVQYSVALGSILGEGSVRKGGCHTYSLRIRHGCDRVDYARWKCALFGDLATDVGPRKTSWGFSVLQSVDLEEVAEQSYVVVPCAGGRTGRKKGKSKQNRRLSAKLLQDLDLLAVAIWYMDDACFSGSYAKWGHGKVEISCKNYTVEERQLLALRLVDLGLPAPVLSAGGFRWSGKRTQELQEKLAAYIHPSMEYKLHPQFRGRFEDRSEWYEGAPIRVRVVPVKVLDVYPKPHDGMPCRYDLQVEGTHTYVVDGVIVHNSPETLPGGLAMGFATSMELKLLNGKYLMDDETGKPLAVDFPSRVEKNKTGLPKMEATYRLILSDTEYKRQGQVYDEDWLVRMAEKVGLLTGSGGAYTMLGQKYAGKKALEIEMLKDRELYATVRQSVMSILLAGT